MGSRAVSSAPHMLLVAHSLGGLIVKQMLRRCSDSVNADFNALGRSVLGVAFLGTPHQGAHAATALDLLLGRFKSKQVKQLAYSDDGLIDLNDFFRSWAGRHGATVCSYYETEKTGGVHIVDKVTANPGVLGSEPIAVQSNHIDICKPATKTAPVYASICALIRKLLKIIPSPSDTGADSGPATSPASGRAYPVHCAAEPAMAGGVVPADVLADYEYYTTTAEDDRRDLAQKLADAGRSYAIRDANRKKERFTMALRRRIAQPAAVIRYTQLMADLETRFNRHVSRVVAAEAGDAAIDQAVQDQVIGPCIASHSTTENEITAGLVDCALYYLALQLSFGVG